MHYSGTTLVDEYRARGVKFGQRRSASNTLTRRLELDPSFAPRHPPTMMALSWIATILCGIVALPTTPLVKSQSTNATCGPATSWVLHVVMMYRSVSDACPIQTENIRDQSPCLVAAYLMGACQPDGRKLRYKCRLTSNQVRHVEWMVDNLPELNLTYAGPAADQADLCTCSSVSYSMVSACAWCQGAQIPG